MGDFDPFALTPEEECGEGVDAPVGADDVAGDAPVIAVDDDRGSATLGGGAPADVAAIVPPVLAVGPPLFEPCLDPLDRFPRVAQGLVGARGRGAQGRFGGGRGRRGRQPAYKAVVAAMRPVDRPARARPLESRACAGAPQR